jgi:tetratricopeptide (TPR) repeat protein
MKQDIANQDLSRVLANLSFGATKSKRRYCFILGSGASRESGIPTGLEIIDQLLPLIFQQQKSRLPKNDAEIRSWATKDTLSIPSFRWSNRGFHYGKIFNLAFPNEKRLAQGFLQKLMENKSPSYGYSVLSRILSYTNNSIVITTNFDHLMEDAIRKYTFTDPKIIHDPALAEYGRQSFIDGDAVILKLHGDMHFKTFNYYDDIQKLDLKWKPILRDIFNLYTPIFIGYGGNDVGFMRTITKLDLSDLHDPPIWFHLGDVPKSTWARNFMAARSGNFVAGPRFDELMLLIGSAFDVRRYEQDYETERGNQQAAWMRSFEQVADGVLQLPEPRTTAIPDDHVEYREAFRESTLRLLQPSGHSNWWEWHFSARIQPTLRETTDNYEKGIRALGNHPTLRACFAHHKARNLQDRDKSLIQATEAKHDATLRFGEEHPDTIATRHQLARVLDVWGGDCRQDAENEYRSVLRLRQKALNDRHPDTIASFSNLAQFLFDEGKYEESARTLRQALDIQRKYYGEKNEVYQTLDDQHKVSSFRSRNRICVVHQPHFLPWTGYFNKLFNCDVFVMLDDVQYRKGYFQNRTKLTNPDGRIFWETLPVHASTANHIKNVSIAGNFWKQKLTSTLRHCYGKTKYFSLKGEQLISEIEQMNNNLYDVNEHLLRWVLNEIDIQHIEINKESDYTVSSERTQRIIDICKSTNASHIIFGEGGSLKCHEIARIESEGIKVLCQHFRDNFRSYGALHPSRASGMSVIDALMKLGTFGTRQLLSSSWTLGQQE